jgi:predicted MFS family arabinose efflux permease
MFMVGFGFVVGNGLVGWVSDSIKLIRVVITISLSEVCKFGAESPV